MNAPSLIQDFSGIINLEGDGGGIIATIWGSRRFFTAFLSPIFMWWLFSSQANGSMTNAVELASSKYGNNPEYKKYLESVPLIVPGIAKWLKQLLPGSV